MGDENEKKILTPEERMAKALDDLNTAGGTYMGVVEESGKTYNSDLDTIGTNLTSSINESGTDMETAGNTYVGIADTWIQAAKNRAETQRKSNEEMEQQNKRVRTIGGLAEAASALVNVLGTVHGASNQQWQSPQPQWAERADKYRLERDRKLENYREMKQTLERQKAQIQYGIGTDAAKRKADNARTFADLEAKKAAVNYNSAVDLAKAGVEAATTSANTAIRGIDVLLGNAARQQSNYNDSRRIAVYERNQGMDPRTGKFYNPATGQYDLDAPHISMGQDNSGNPGGGDPDEVMRTAFAADTSVLDELVRSFGDDAYSSYADYVAAGNDRHSAKAKRKLDEEHKEIANLIRKFNDSTGTSKFTVADLNLLERYAPEYYEKYKRGMGVVAADAWPEI